MIKIEIPNILLISLIMEYITLFKMESKTKQTDKKNQEGLRSDETVTQYWERLHGNKKLRSVLHQSTETRAQTLRSGLQPGETVAQYWERLHKQQAIKRQPFKRQPFKRQTSETQAEFLARLRQQRADDMAEVEKFLKDLNSKV